ncbi:ABC transporter ATP-binding protein [Desulfitobacterium chlororespirans]|uniref:ATP-binding cassette, subfamily B n=1 Tax=Desulfitobacterium chlororespirans DSM 11544 TaxID=1121395 RepID=A0A1M7TIJ5_9FIRM|nr:ABC transporter ATP-binding protein [Desulfitobacterium chlororespirans]SHN70545.1 ATP-binding cassette, subfamily B [Desulfitobacterium chlororespirans DSM 11544]
MEHTQAPSPLARLAEFAGPHKGKYLASVILAVIGVAAGLVPYFAVAQMIIELIGGGREPGFYLSWCAVAAAGFIFKSVCMNVSTTFSHRATFAVISEVRFRLTSKLTRVPMGYLLDTPSGKLKTTIVERTDSIESPLAHVLPEMTANLLVPLGIIVYLFSLDWRMALVSLITLPIGLFAYMAMMKDYAVKYAAVTNAGKHMSATTVEYINGIEVIKAFNQSAASYAKFTDAVKQNTGLVLEWMRATQGYSAVAQSVWPAVLVGVLPVGCIFYLNGTLDAPTFITVMILSLGIIGPLVAAMFFTDDIAKIGTIVSDIGIVLDTPDLERPTEKRQLNGSDIELKDVSFAYKDEQVLRNVNLEIAAGSVTALVGPSGSGKSTIAKLIASLWDVGGGTIALGGTDIRDIPLEQLMDHIAYVAQDNYLFDQTVRDNIRMGKPNATDAEVEEAARASGCHEFILKLERGYDTVAGGAGGHLSGGERQRIAIARAMLKNAPVVILDEATSYTDPENEAVIQEAVAKLVAGKTLIVIAHRLSTITDSDKIVVVSQGRIVAEGRHEELLAGCELYRGMWQAHLDAKDAM